MAQFYNLALPSGSGPGWVTPLADQKRFGLLTAPAWLVDGAGKDEVNPIKRGVWIRGRLLCRDLPPPPAEIPPMPEPVPTKTKRELYEQHRANPVCALCHAGIDPLGFALENYDGLGKWRMTDGQFDIDPAGEVPGMKFSGLEDLAQQLSTSPEVRSCAVQQWFRYGFGRPVVSDDQCALESLGKAFAEGGYRTRALLLALVVSETFTTLPAAAP
jgi:hypothetical protein